MFKKLLRGLGTVAKIAPVLIPVLQPAVLINNVVAAGVKHFTKIDNQAIPGLNIVTSSAGVFVKNGLVTGDWSPETIISALVTGTTLAAGSTATHQGAKIFKRQVIDKQEK